MAMRKDKACIVVTRTCRNHHETAYAVVGVDFDDVLMGTKALDMPDLGCLWPNCKSTQFITQTVFNSKLVEHDY